MIAWIESHSVAGIVVLGLALCYAIAAAVLAAAFALRARPAAAAALRATSPAMLTPMATVAALLIAFLAARVWANLDRANALVAREAGALRRLDLLGNALPGETRTALQGAVRTYVHFVEAEDFPAMAAGRATPQQPPGLTQAVGTLLAFAPAGPSQQLAQQHAVAAAEDALAARHERLLLSRTAVAPIQWGVVLVLDALMLSTIAMVHLDRRVTAAVNVFVYSTAIAACLVLLMVNDRPFSAGGYTVGPHALHEIAAERLTE